MFEVHLYDLSCPQMPEGNGCEVFEQEIDSVLFVLGFQGFGSICANMAVL